MAMKQLKAADLDVEFRQELKKSLDRYADAIGVIVYSNNDLSSRFIGQQVALPFGPSNTVKSLEHAAELKRYPFDPPLGYNWQYYPEGWIPREEFA